jgi:O-succinylbenzoate synthase
MAPLPSWSQETLEEAKANPHGPSSLFAHFSASLPPLSSPLTLPFAGLSRGPICKLKVGHLRPEEALRLVDKTRAKEIRVDVNRRWSLEEALFFAERASVFFIEEPCQDLLAFSQRASLPIAIDESYNGTFPSYARYLIWKPTLRGPHFPKGIDIILSSAYETGVGIGSIARLYEPWMRAPGLDTLQGDFLKKAPEIGDSEITFFSLEPKKELLWLD